MSSWIIVECRTWSGYVFLFRFRCRVSVGLPPLRSFDLTNTSLRVKTQSSSSSSIHITFIIRCFSRQRERMREGESETFTLFFLFLLRLWNRRVQPIGFIRLRISGGGKTLLFSVLTSVFSFISIWIVFEWITNKRPRRVLKLMVNNVCCLNRWKCFNLYF